MLQDLFITLIHIYAFFFYVRFLYPGANQSYFNPLMQNIRNMTEPVLKFFPNNKMGKFILPPILPIAFLILIKSGVIVSTIGQDHAFREVLLYSLQGFVAFVFQVYFFMIWITFAAPRYNLFDSFFNLIADIVDRSIRMITPPKKNISIQKGLWPCIGAYLLFFLAAFYIMNLNHGVRDALVVTIKPGRFVPTSISIALLEVLKLLTPLLFLRIILSFFDPAPNIFYLSLIAITEPLLEPFRKLRLMIGMFDFSPIVALIALNLIIQLVHAFFVFLSMAIGG